MKKSKFFALTTVLLALGLVACGEKKSDAPATKSEAPVSQQAPVSSEAAPVSSEPAPTSQGGGQTSQGGGATSVEPPVTKAVTVSSFGLSKKTDNKVYMTVAGTSAGFTGNELKFALALAHTGDVTGGDQKTGYAVGGETFADADYSIQATLGNEGAFTLEYNLSDVANIGGSYFITLGVKGIEEIATPTTHDDVELLDATYRFYYRNDISNKLTLHADEIPPLSFTEASIVTEDGKIWAKIGGTAKAGLTQAELDGYDTFIQFQQVGGSWSKTRLSKADGQFKWKLESTKAFLYADVSWWNAGANYNTHLNVKYGSEANCKMEVALDQHYNVQNAAGNWLDINVYSNPQASGSDQSEFWGNLGFKVTAGVEPGVHVHTLEEVGTKANSNGKNVKLEKCADDGYRRISMNATEGVVGGNGQEKTGKLNKGGYYDYEINLNTTADLTNVALVIGRNDSHYERHMFNEAIWNRDHPDATVALPSRSPDTVEEDEWRYKIEVINNGVSTEFPITNMQTPKEANGGNNPSGTFYFAFGSVTLKNGTNILRITRNNIGYSAVFNGDLRLDFETNATVALADAPAA